MARQNIGYSGDVTLVSPSGEQKIVKLPGRCKGWMSKSWENVSDYRPRKVNDRSVKQFYRLLSAGWKVLKVTGTKIQEGVVGEEQKKDTDQVDGSTKTGQNSHGGDNASKEVKDSPNAAQDGENTKMGQSSHGGDNASKEVNDSPNTAQDKRKRGKRGGRAKKKQERDPYKKTLSKRRSGGVGVYAPTPVQVNKKLLGEAEESAKLLAKLIGTSHLKQPHNTTVDTMGLLMALETGDNPLPYLEAPDEQTKLRILITPDCSGSTQGWSGLGQGWALHLAKYPEVDVIYAKNYNGSFRDFSDEACKKMIKSADVVVYLGDGDGLQLAREYAASGAKVVGMDCYSASIGKPRLRREKHGQGTLFWIDRVCAKTPETWTEGLRMALK